MTLKNNHKSQAMFLITFGCGLTLWGLLTITLMLLSSPPDPIALVDLQLQIEAQNKLITAESKKLQGLHKQLLEKYKK